MQKGAVKYIKGLDTIRAVAIFFVILEHWGPYFAKGTTPYYFLHIPVSGGLFGVNMFFVLSGFLITSILLNDKLKYEGDNRLVLVKNFYIRRSLRIFPIYYLVIFYSLFTNFDIVYPNLAYFLTYTSNVLHYRANVPTYLSYTWSLAVEEQFYLIWPWVIVFTSLKNLKYVIGGFILMGLLSKAFVIFVLHHQYAALMINCTDFFGIGALYALYRLNAEGCARFERFFITLLPVLLFLSWRLAPLSGTAGGALLVFVTTLFITLAPIVFVLKNRSAWVRTYLLENPVAVYVGKISYGLYLFHMPVGIAVNRLITAHFSGTLLANYNV